MRGDGSPQSLAHVTVESAEEELVVSVVRSGALGADSSAWLSGIAWDDLCTAPCSFFASPGARQLILRSPHLFQSYTLRLKPGQTVVRVDPGSPALRTLGGVLTSVGVLALFTGGSLALTRLVLPEEGRPDWMKWGAPIALSGLALTIGGLSITYAGRVKIDHRSTPAPAPRASQHLLMAQGTF